MHKYSAEQPKKSALKRCKPIKSGEIILTIVRKTLVYMLGRLMLRARLVITTKSMQMNYDSFDPMLYNNCTTVWKKMMAAGALKNNFLLAKY